MKTFFLIVAVIIIIDFSYLYSQSNFIQSIDFDSQQRTVYGLTGFYDSSYACRYKDGILESWNLTDLFSLPFFHISTTVDENDNIWAFLQNTIYKFDGISWSDYSIPEPPLGYQKYADLSIHNGFLWLTTLNGAIYSDNALYKLNIDSMTWKIFSSSNSNFPDDIGVGQIYHTGDSTWIGTSKGLLMVFNDSVSVELDTTSIPDLPSEQIYCFYIDSQKNRWLGTFDAGLIKWIDNSNFIEYNTSNSALPHNFVNKIDHDSEGRLWLATDGGLASFYNNSITSYSNLTSGKGVVTLAVDELDRIWIGEMGTGRLLVYDGASLISITDVEDEFISTANEFYLSQNYPNPFNPSTDIKYQIPEAGLVSLKVYDLLGREVATLVDEHKTAGSYEVEFNVSELSSGVYFYKLRAGEYSNTKKMMLSK